MAEQKPVILAMAEQKPGNVTVAGQLSVIGEASTNQEASASTNQAAVNETPAEGKREEQTEQTKQ